MTSGIVVTVFYRGQLISVACDHERDESNQGTDEHGEEHPSNRTSSPLVCQESHDTSEHEPQYEYENHDLSVWRKGPEIARRLFVAAYTEAAWWPSHARRGLRPNTANGIPAYYGTDTQTRRHGTTGPLISTPHPSFKTSSKHLQT